MRAFWSGEIVFGLVTIPARLYTATKDLTPHFHLLHKECGTPIVTVRRCPKHKRDLTWDEIGKGYEVSQGKYVLFTAEELRKLEGDEDGSTIEIVQFIDPDEVDLAYVENSYWVAPAGKNMRGYELLRRALESKGKVALAKVRLRTRTRLALVRPRGRMFALDILRHADELVPSDEIAPAAEKAPTSRETQLAEHLVDELVAKFDPAKLPDAYRSAVLSAVGEKLGAGETTDAEQDAEAASEAKTHPAGARVIDLTALLTNSIRGAQRGRSAEGKGSRGPGGPIARAPAKGAKALAADERPVRATKTRRSAR